LIYSKMYSQEKILTLTSEEKEIAIEKVASLLSRFYVYPEIAEKMISHIKSQHQSGFFNKITDPTEFANALTKELRTICDDKHLALFIGSNPDQQTSEERVLRRTLDNLYRERNNYGINKLEILQGNIGYMNIRTALYFDQVKEIIDNSLRFLSKTDVLIFDLRENGGGDPQYMAYLFSYLFEKPTQLSSIYFRDRDKTYDFWTSEKVVGKKMADIPVFVLTSKNTFSAAESFAYDLQTYKRATIVGENTKGGANPASSWVVYKDLRISIPLGRAINPLTKTNWEGKGVKPDIEVTADSALAIAHKEALTITNKCLEEKKKRITESFGQFNSDISNAVKQFEANQPKKADSLVINALSNAIRDFQYSEHQINSLGYDFINQGNYKMAISILKYNATTFPNSSNAFDSLGEAYMKNGQKDMAIENYEKSLELNPNNTNAKEMLKQLKGITK
jgi:tetratricopeptide (TPR) repeat protein